MKDIYSTGWKVFTKVDVIHRVKHFMERHFEVNSPDSFLLQIHENKILELGYNFSNVFIGQKLRFTDIHLRPSTEI